MTSDHSEDEFMSGEDSGSEATSDFDASDSGGSDSEEEGPLQHVPAAKRRRVEDLEGLELVSAGHAVAATAAARATDIDGSEEAEASLLQLEVTELLRDARPDASLEAGLLEVLARLTALLRSLPEAEVSPAEAASVSGFLLDLAFSPVVSLGCMLVGKVALWMTRHWGTACFYAAAAVDCRHAVHLFSAANPPFCWCLCYNPRSARLSSARPCAWLPWAVLPCARRWLQPPPSTSRCSCPLPASTTRTSSTTGGEPQQLALEAGLGKQVAACNPWAGSAAVCTAFLADGACCQPGLPPWFPSTCPSQRHHPPLPQVPR